MPDDAASIGTREVLAEAAERLRLAGMDNAVGDARQLLAHVLGTEPSRLLLLTSVEAEPRAAFAALVTERARRVPLQHLTGAAYFRHERLEVGPGVFVPRPETEVMTGWALDQLRPWVAAGESPLVVEPVRRLWGHLPGAGARAAGPAGARRRGVGGRGAVGGAQPGRYRGRAAHRGHGHGPAGAGCRCRPGDRQSALHPVGRLRVGRPEVRDHDPTIALFSGDDGLDAMRVLAGSAARLLRDDGLVCAEHAEVQAESAPAVFLAAGTFSAVRDHPDLAGRPRFVTARRRPRA